MSNSSHTLSQEGTIPKRARSKFNRSEAWWGYLFILPSIVGLFVFVLYPLATSVYLALTKWDGLNEPVFVGFKNFDYMFSKDPAFWPSLKATLIFTLLNVPVTVGAGLLLAVLLNRKMPGIRFFRTILYLPTILPLVAVMGLWKFMYQPQFGIINSILQTLHLPTSNWLSDETMAIPSIVIISLWGVGSTMIIFLAGLQAVPQELYEAARIDGAGTIRLFWNITIPMISPILFLQVVTQMIVTLQAFIQPRLLTEGGPNNATNFLMYNIYSKGFGSLGSFPDLGYATALMWILFFLIMFVTFFIFRFSNFWVYSDNRVD